MRVFDSTEATQYELQACLKVLKSMGLLLNYDYMGRCKESFVKSELGPAQERERERAMIPKTMSNITSTSNQLN